MNIIAELKKTSKIAAEEFIPCPKIEAGDEGELIIRKLLRRELSSWRNCAIYHGPRIPHPSGKGKMEIDFIIATRFRIFVVEVKNFSGSLVLASNNKDWKQTKEGKSAYHSDPVEIIEAKGRAVKRFLEEKGIPCSMGDIKTALVLTHNKVVISGALAKNEKIFFSEDFAESMSKFRKKHSGSLLGKNALQPLYKMSQLKKALDTLPTWDTLILHGGKKIRGDIINTPFQKIIKEEKIETIKIFQPRSLLTMLIFPAVALLFKTGSRIPRIHFIKKVKDKFVTIHPAGRREPKQISLLNIYCVDIDGSGE